MLDSNKVHAQTSVLTKTRKPKVADTDQRHAQVVQDAHTMWCMEKETLDIEKEITRHQNTSAGRGASSAVQEQHVVKEQWQV